MPFVRQKQLIGKVFHINVFKGVEWKSNYNWWMKYKCNRKARWEEGKFKVEDSGGGWKDVDFYAPLSSEDPTPPKMYFDQMALFAVNVEGEEALFELPFHRMGDMLLACFTPAWMGDLKDVRLTVVSNGKEGKDVRYQFRKAKAKESAFPQQAEAPSSSGDGLPF